jgi:DnaJ-class molecular chaperone
MEKQWDKDIVICTNCGGRGKNSTHIGFGDYMDEVCPYCEGSGRMVRETVIKFKPYKPKCKKCKGKKKKKKK